MAGRRQCASSRIGWDPAPAGERATFPRACAPGDGIDIVPVSLDGVCIPGSRNNAHLLPSLESLHSHGRRLCATMAFSRIAAISKPPTALVRNGSGICPLPVEHDRRSTLGPAARGSGGGGARPPRARLDLPHPARHPRDGRGCRGRRAAPGRRRCLRPPPRTPLHRGLRPTGLRPPPTTAGRTPSRRRTPVGTSSRPIPRTTLPASGRSCVGPTPFGATPAGPSAGGSWRAGITASPFPPRTVSVSSSSSASTIRRAGEGGARGQTSA